MKQTFTTTILLLYVSSLLAQPYRVQVAAFIEKVPSEYFTRVDLTDVYLLTDQNDIYRYYIGEYDNRDEAMQVMIKAINVGFKNAQIIDMEEQRKLCGSPCPHITSTTTYYDESSEFLRVRNVFFGFAKSTISQEAKLELDDLYLLLKANPGFEIQLSGYTDSKGDAKTNVELSKRRARNAKNYLVHKGIKSTRMHCKVFGESNPFASNKDASGRDDPEGRKYNRRVVLTIFDPQKGQIINKYN